MKKAKYGYYNSYSFNRRTKKERIEYVQKNVFDSDAFKEHINKTSMLTNVDREVVRKVLEYYLLKISLLCNAISKHTRTVTLHGFMKIIIQAGNRI